MLASVMPEPNAFAATLRMALTVQWPRFLRILHFRTAGRQMRHAGVVGGGKEKPDSREPTSLHASFTPFYCLCELILDYRSSESGHGNVAHPMVSTSDLARCRRNHLVFVGALALDFIAFSLLASHSYGKASGRGVVWYDWLTFDLVSALGGECRVVYCIPSEDEMLRWHPEKKVIFSDSMKH